MVVKKQKKVNRYRSHTTHGGGHRKKRRGAGSRGGRGNAGTGKRAGQKVAGMKPKLGSKGFTSHSRTKIIAINLSFFTQEKLAKLVEAGKLTKEGDSYVIELSKLGYNKLLGTGSISVKLIVIAEHFSGRAEEKVKNAGGLIKFSHSGSVSEAEKLVEKVSVE